MICTRASYPVNRRLVQGPQKEVQAGPITKSGVLFCFELRAFCSDIIQFSATFLVVVIRNLVKSFSKNAKLAKNTKRSQTNVEILFHSLNLTSKTFIGQNKTFIGQNLTCFTEIGNF